MGLTNSELAGMREAIEQLLPQSCNILSVTLTPDGQGGNTESWGTASANVACRLDVISGTEMTTAGALQPYTRSMLSMPYDTTVSQDNRIELGSNTYAVKTVNTDQAWIAVKRCELEQIDG